MGWDERLSHRSGWVGGMGILLGAGGDGSDRQTGMEWDGLGIGNWEWELGMGIGMGWDGMKSGKSFCVVFPFACFLACSGFLLTPTPPPGPCESWYFFARFHSWEMKFLIIRNILFFPVDVM